MNNTESASWGWKAEPPSPIITAVDNESETWVCEDVTQYSPVSSVPEEKPVQLTRAEIASKLLDDLDIEWVKEEPLSDWLEEKIDLPIFEDIPSVESSICSHYLQGNNEPVKPIVSLEVKNFNPSTQIVVTEDTQTLLQEFETVFGRVEQNNGTLTPPQSPLLPLQSNTFPEDVNGGHLLLANLERLIPVQTLQLPNHAPIKIMSEVPILPVVLPEKKETLLTNLEQMVPTLPVPDLARELADVDELIRTRIEDLEPSLPLSATWCSNISTESGSDDTLSTIPLSPATSSNGFESGEEQCDDPDWIPVSVNTKAPGAQKTTGSRKRGVKPYSRVGLEEKRMRKKEQNKNAATRYRQKKKAEIEEILSEEKGLEDKNSELQQKVSELAREIKYLKGLMRDVFRAKGLIK